MSKTEESFESLLLIYPNLNIFTDFLTEKEDERERERERFVYKSSWYIIYDFTVKVGQFIGRICNS